MAGRNGKIGQNQYRDRCWGCQGFTETVGISLEERKPYEILVDGKPYLRLTGNMMQATSFELVEPYCHKAGRYVNCYSQRPCENGSEK